MMLVSSFALADKEHECEIQGTEANGTRIVLGDNKFLSKGSKNIFDYSKPTKFCPLEGSPSNCQESGSWLTLREFVKFKALGNEVICSYYHISYNFKEPAQNQVVSYDEMSKKEQIVYFVKSGKDY